MLCLWCTGEIQKNELCCFTECGTAQELFSRDAYVEMCCVIIDGIATQSVNVSLFKMFDEIAKQI